MKTKELIDTLNWYALLLEKRFKEYGYTKRDEEAIIEIIKRLKELGKLKKKKGEKKKDHTEYAILKSEW